MEFNFNKVSCRDITMTRFVLIFLLLACSWSGSLQAEGRHPNIVWISVEDMSPDLGCYGDRYTSTPHLDRFASQSLRYTNAFATAPVCSPARCCLITGMYATSLGTQRLRSHFPLPAWCEPFPALLRRAGYFTTNNVKTDYNVREEAELIRAAWDQNGNQAHWRQRAGDQPFFSVFNLMTTHQSRTSVWSHEQFESEIGSKLTADQRHDPQQVPLPPFYPDTPETRRGMARYYDCITRMDQQVAEILAQLEEDGLADNTIVFFFSDHGMGMPRGKRLLHDSGMHVPLMIRMPAGLQAEYGVEPGTVSHDLVSFVDFAPTVLRIAGLEIPAAMQGMPFLGERTSRRSYVYGARDRVDEVDDLSRSVRNQRYLYIRNYMPHFSWMPPEWYSDQSVLRQELAELRDAGRLNAKQMSYAAAMRAREELYDCQRDPNQLNNLADNEEYLAVLEQMRDALRAWQLETRDLGFLPESETWRRLNADTPWDLAKDETRYPLEQILKVAGTVGFVAAEPVAAADAPVRFWRVLAQRNAEKVTSELSRQWQRDLKDPAPSVRIEAAAAILSRGHSPEASQVLREAIQGRDVDVKLRAMRAFQLNTEHASIDRDIVESVYEEAVKNENAGLHPNWMFVRFSADAVLNP